METGETIEKQLFQAMVSIESKRNGNSVTTWIFLILMIVSIESKRNGNLFQLGQIVNTADRFQSNLRGMETVLRYDV